MSAKREWVLEAWNEDTKAWEQQSISLPTHAPNNPKDRRWMPSDEPMTMAKVIREAKSWEDQTRAFEDVVNFGVCRARNVRTNDIIMGAIL